MAAIGPKRTGACASVRRAETISARARKERNTRRLLMECLQSRACTAYKVVVRIGSHRIQRPTSTACSRSRNLLSAPNGLLGKPVSD